jgi:transposase InsO family protein
VYCVAVMDAYSRLIVGWSIAEHMRTELVTDALGMAIIRRQPDNNLPTSKQYCTPTTVRNILLGASVNACARPGSSLPWEVSVTVTTTP